MQVYNQRNKKDSKNLILIVKHDFAKTKFPGLCGNKYLVRTDICLKSCFDNYFLNTSMLLL